MVGNGLLENLKEHSMNNITFISYYTEGVYEQVINTYLVPSLQKFHLTYLLKEYPSRNTWGENIKYKPQFILDTLNEVKTDLVFLDADAQVCQYPQLFFDIEDSYDIGVHYLDWFEFWKNQHNQKKFELLSGTLFIRNNEHTKKLVFDWNERTKKSNEVEQKVLENLLLQYPHIKIYKLPRTYCRILRNTESITESIIIAHNQASRKYRNKKC